MSVVLIDHGLCNTGSARRAFEECGARVIVSSDPASLRDATHAVLPGVGSFAEGMKQLRAQGWPEALVAARDSGAVAILGICLGMQLLADAGDEGGETRGLGLVAGRVTRMTPQLNERLPHVGWNEVEVVAPCPLFEGIPSGTDFYFVHSYALTPAEATTRLASVPYGGGIAAAVGQGRVFGVQFHPEKSSAAGFRLLKNFLAQ